VLGKILLDLKSYHEYEATKGQRTIHNDALFNCPNIGMVKCETRGTSRTHEQNTEFTQSYNHKTCREYITSQS